MNERMKIARKKLGYTQVDVATKLGYTQPAYSALESGKYPLNERHVKNFCSLLGINERWLETGKGEMLQKNEMVTKFNELFFELPDYCKEYIVNNMIIMLKEFPSYDPDEQEEINNNTLNQ